TQTLKTDRPRASSITARARSEPSLTRVMSTTSDSFAAVYLREVGEIVRAIAPAAVDALAEALADVRDREGRLFVLGVGGGAAHASHAVNDFRKLCGFEAYVPNDKVAEPHTPARDGGRM